MEKVIKIIVKKKGNCYISENFKDLIPTRMSEEEKNRMTPLDIARATRGLRQCNI